jgi:PleD family two-component response regulator
MKKEYKILVADDNSEVREAVKKALNESYELNIVSTPEAAINYNEKFDLLLTDFYFGKDKKRGLNIIKELREKKKGLYTILMSSDLNPKISSKCAKLNIPIFPKYEDNITPIDENKLKDLIKSYLK